MPGYSAASLCARLSPDNPIIPCISLSPYLTPSDHPYHPPHDQLTQPCKGDPCNTSQICQDCKRRSIHTRYQLARSAYSSTKWTKRLSQNMSVLISWTIVSMSADPLLSLELMLAR
ncbi:hypothetical protein LSTR_LSTR015847 [Laodelphax striatellus]|uniref:Uncharacterized protein n=1 Tax=Laodelphax striatellus TaxID=195883 RepID=A0A482XBW3_LAOST|nr:hypothetical protein LSTR_LSTR015847 [Laodelphax striatellus]